MTLTPRSEVFLSFAIDAMAPPAACRRSEMKSRVMKILVYVIGLSRETDIVGSNKVTTRLRQR